MTVQPVLQPVVRDILALSLGRVKCQEVPFGTFGVYICPILDNGLDICSFKFNFVTFFRGYWELWHYCRTFYRSFGFVKIRSNITLARFLIRAEGLFVQREFFHFFTTRGAIELTLRSWSISEDLSSSILKLRKSEREGAREKIEKIPERRRDRRERDSRPDWDEF